MTILFFVREAAQRADPPALPDDLSAHWWLPAVDGAPPRGLRSAPNLGWWAMTRGGGLARPDLAVLTLRQGERPVHRLLVTPRWWRFPFMAAADLQIGDLWTDPHLRRRGLAALGMGLAIARFGPTAPRLWYAVEAQNRPSIALAERCGFRRIGEGLRTAPAGLRALGRYRIDTVSG